MTNGRAGLPVLELDRVVFRRGDTTILDDVSMRMERGEISVILNFR